MIVVSYMGGCCGDLVSALIDPATAKFTGSNILLSKQREFFKLHPTASLADKNNAYIELSSLYQSAPSHQLEYHLDHSHQVIGIVVEDKELALWAANRFKTLHLPRVWQKICVGMGISTVEEYAESLIGFSTKVSNCAQKIITLADIVNGKAILALGSHGISCSTHQMYSKWLKLNNLA